MNWTDALPPGYTGSIGLPDDLEQLRALIEASDLAIEGESNITIDSLEVRFGEPDFDGTSHIALVRDTSDVLVGAGIMYFLTPFVSTFSQGHVHPNHVGMGIGGALLAWMRKTAEDNVVLAAPEHRVVLAAGISSDNQRARRLLTKRGFTEERYFLDMEIDLDDSIAVSGAPAGVAIRKMRPDEEVDQLAAAVALAFQDHFGFTERPPEVSAARWRNFRDSESWDDDLVWIAEDDDGIVGFNVSLRSNGANTDQGYVASLGVVPDWRGRGLARHLLTASFAEYKERAMKSVRLDVDAASITGATRLYEGVGMTEVQRHVDYEIEIRPGTDIVTR